MLLESYEDAKSINDGFTLIDIDRKMSLSIHNNENPEYLRDELIHLLSKYEMLQQCIMELRLAIIKSEDQKLSSTEKHSIKQKKERLKEQIEQRDKVFDMHKLRRTVIKGIPCRFIEFKRKLLPKNDPDMCEEYVFVTVGPNQQDEPNLRGKIWNIICHQDSIQQNALNSYRQARKEIVVQMAHFEKKHKDFADEDVNESEMTGSKLKQYQEFLDLKKQYEQMPIIETPEELFECYKSKPLPTKLLESNIENDLDRSDPGNVDWKVPY